ncbi:hypothetical protein [Microvirga sp. Mcv34]|uniref:hypothetical protein n=1 Tax=Microvirga sp. Mcv34 TaxID=2926016 RepID=UPI0021C8E6E3|nr:hypothetical protein [Microvirga sp. Mcv34]
MADPDHETWLLNTGDRVVAKKSAQGFSSLTPFERLVYCLWIMDYAMRNAGDLMTADDLHPSFMLDGKAAAQALGLQYAMAAFELSTAELEQRYFSLFDDILIEVRSA